MATINADAVITWYRNNARELPWRTPDVTAYGVLVSEVMAQQTPVERVAPSWVAWMQLWPDPGALAKASPAQVLRMWGRLGYPRRALRLREAAVACVERHQGQIPATYEELLALPGIGDYTASAVLAFAYKQRALPLDTNIRRVLARHISGVARPAVSVTNAERDLADDVLPKNERIAAEFAQALMEFGAVICTATKPSCALCPVSDECSWLKNGKPESEIRPRAQKFTGTDRQVRGLLMAVLREHATATKSQLDLVWSDDEQRDRALNSLLADGLVEAINDDLYQLPH